MSVKPDPVMMTLPFNACAKLSNDASRTFGINALDKLPQLFLHNDNLVNSAIDMLMRFGDIQRAERLFSQTRQRNTNIFNVMLNGYNINDRPSECLRLFKELQERNLTIDVVMAVALIGACTQIGLLSTCRRILAHLPVELGENVRVRIALVDMWVSIISTSLIVLVLERYFSLTSVG